MTADRHLPKFVKPMLAKAGRPFDSDDHLFEIKWDGLRVSLYVEHQTHRLLSRHGMDMTDRYPELGDLARLPSGTVLDGELVVLDQAGVPDFGAVLSRAQARSAHRIQRAAGAAPATLMAFDLLYCEYESLVARPFRVRRQRLLETLHGEGTGRVIASDGVIGPGTAFYEEVVSRQLEGVVAKRLDSTYLPGKRSDAWTKIRKRSSVLCAIIGYVPRGDDFESLILATDEGGKLHCVGRVGNGFNAALRRRLNPLLRANESDEPLIPCGESGRWLKAGLYCAVHFLERTRGGDLREPVFERLVEST